jgi:hypothetical protein
MPNPLTPYPENSGERTDLVVAAIVDNPMVFEYVGRLADAISLATPTDQVFNLIDKALLEQAITGAVTRFVESAIDGQL